VIVQWWSTRWWDTPSFYVNMKRTWTNQHCVNFMEEHTDAYGIKEGANVTRTVYSDDVTCVDFWQRVYDNYGVAGVNAEIKRAYEQNFKDITACNVTLPAPVYTVVQFWPDLVNMVGSNNASVTNQAVAAWAPNPLAGYNISMVGDAWYPHYTGWINSGLLSSCAALSTKFGVTCPTGVAQICDTANPYPFASNYTTLTIGTTGTASPYPAVATVSDISCTLTRVNVRLIKYNVDSAYVNMVLAHTDGATTTYVALDLATAYQDTANLPKDLSFWDLGVQPGYPYNDDQTYSPGRWWECAGNPAPCTPTGLNYTTFQSTLSAFNGQNSRGSWKLYVDNYGGASTFAGTIKGFEVYFTCVEPRPGSKREFSRPSL